MTLKDYGTARLAVTKAQLLVTLAGKKLPTCSSSIREIAYRLVPKLFPTSFGSKIDQITNTHADH